MEIQTRGLLRAALPLLRRRMSRDLARDIALIKARLEGPAGPRPPGPDPAADGSQAALRAVKAIHTLAWFSIEACMAYVLYAGFARRSDRRAGIAAGSGRGRDPDLRRERVPLPAHPGRRAAGRRAGLGHRHLPAPVVRPQPARHPRPADRPGRIPPRQKPPDPALTRPDLADWSGWSRPASPRPQDDRGSRWHQHGPKVGAGADDRGRPPLGMARITNSPQELRAQIARAGTLAEGGSGGDVRVVTGSGCPGRGGSRGAPGAPAGREGVHLPQGHKRRTGRRGPGRPAAERTAAGGVDRAPPQVRELRELTRYCAELVGLRDQLRAQFVNGVNNSWITIPALNLNTNMVTITAWIYPPGSQAAYAGLAFCRSGSTVAGMNHNRTRNRFGLHLEQ